MNDLNLRVAALKLCAHPKRLSEMRGSLVPIPSKWQDSQCNYVLQFVAATSCTEQISVVKQLFEKPEAFAFLSDVLFVSPLKHSLRGQLTKLFSNQETGKRANTTHTKEALLSVLCESLRHLSEIIDQPDVPIDLLNDVFVSIGACLHNFSYGREALSKEIHCFIPMVPRALDRFWKSISEANEDLSPTRRNEFYLFIQNLLRFHVNFLVDFKLLLKPEKCQDLRLIDKLAESVARHVDTPWDVRSIAGLSIGHNARFFSEFDDYLTKCKNLTAAEDLPIKSASLLVLQKTDYAEHGEQALDIIKGMLELVKTAGNVTNLLVYMSKHLYTYSKSLSAIHLTDRPLIMYDLILATLLRFSLEHIVSTVESIRHMSANILLQVLQLSKATGQQSIINQVYATFERQRMPTNAVCLMLQQLVETMGTKAVLLNCGSILDKIFPTYLGADDNVNTLYKCMMIAAHKEFEFRDWYNVWCVGLLNQAHPVNDRLPAIERLLKVAVQLDHNVLALMIKHRGLPFSSKLVAMLMARSNGQNRQVKSLMLEYTEQINQAIIGVDDNTRLMALSFVVETPRQSEPYTQFEMDAILSYVENNANSPSAHLRQIGRGLLQKSIKRLDLNLAQQLREKGGTAAGLPDDHKLIKFVNKLMYTLMLNLFPTANYGRRWLSMHLMQDCIEMMERLRLTWLTKLPSQTVTYLFHCLGDSYEHNKALAAQILRMMQLQAHQQPDEMLRLLVSLRPPDSVTAAYQLQVYCQAKDVLVEVPQPEQLPINEPRYFAVLHWLLQHLRLGINQAQGDLTMAAKTNPLYGLLFASRHLLQQLELTKLAEEQLWREYIDQLLSLCMLVSELMLPVVGSDSPEGHLPATQAEFQDETAVKVEEQVEVKVEGETETENDAEADAESNPDMDTLSITPQLVLLCAWRSIKEVSLILGELVELAPLQQEHSHNYLLSKQQVADIGEHFLVLLSEIKHRGAFEQAYVGFTLLCRRFWQSNEPALNQLPPIWLDDAMQLVAGHVEGKEICPTRRSAGVPYMLQALICTELKLGTHNTFSKSMSLLLDVCERREPGPAAAIARSHALNIMRALFRCSELSELVGEFIGRGVKCSLESLDAIEWAERNCATLLLSGLMVRIFGVERARNDVGQLHLRNRMTGRIFFTRYPQLFDYFHGCLRQAAIAKRLGKSSGGQTVQMEAMLQLLTRLYPSPLEGTENTLNLSEFVPFLQKICCVHDNMTRQRASQVLANFMIPTLANKNIRRILLRLKMMNCRHNNLYRPGIRQKKMAPYTRDLNGLHGHLLQLLELYRLVRWQDVRLINMTLHVLSISVLKIYIQDIYLFNAVLNVLTAILLDAKDAKDIESNHLNSLEIICLLDHKMIYERCAKYAISPKFCIVFSLHLHRLTNRPETIMEHMLAVLVRPTYLPETLKQFTVDLWLYMLFQLANHSSKTRGLVDAYEVKNFQFDPDVVSYCKALGGRLHSLVVHLLRESEEVIQYVFNMANQIVEEPKRRPGLGCGVYTLLALMGRLDLTIRELLERRDCGIEPGLALCITRQVMAEGLREPEQQVLWMPLIEYALDIGAPTQKPYLRFKAAQLVDRLTVHIQQLLATGDVQIIGNYMRLVLQLLVDESELVRNYMAEMISSCLNCYIENQQRPRLMPVFSMLPTAAEKFFLQRLLENLQEHSENSSFVIGIFNIIVEPFVSTELLDNRITSEDNAIQITDVCDEAEVVFDKQDPNVYCEGFRVASKVAKHFRTAFPNNTELISALDALEKWSSYSGFGDESIPPPATT
ncbi:thyroid adenoma-associated protein homolog [Drosophila innubila]|uniref:thyroid adenoma-associated protein homolog n=1 Tax=Drosophila innubila TaxID=198719 RepID=UPI00148DED9A|nr:thyroid adenoma-associated protein homolog [Drosophila innubila]